MPVSCIPVLFTPWLATVLPGAPQEFSDEVIQHHNIFSDTADMLAEGQAMLEEDVFCPTFRHILTFM